MQTAIAATTAPAIVARSMLHLRSAEIPAPEAGLVRRYRKDDEIFAEGERAAYVYKVVSGAVRTSKLLCDGRRQIDAFHLEGDIFGIEAGQEYRFSAEAVGDCSVVAYRRGPHGAAGAETFPAPFAMATMQALVRAQNHMLLLGRKNALEKVATFLLDMAERLGSAAALDLPMSRIDIADHLGLTIETVSRSLTQLERQSIIALPTSRRVVFSDKGALRRLRA